jgi:tRNA (guanine37-N1)-methyltransferase
MLTVQLPLKDAEVEKEKLIKKGLLAKGYPPLKVGDYLYVPVTKKYATKYEFFEKELAEQKPILMPLKEALKMKLPAEVLERVKTAYDQVGSIAILEIDADLKAYDTVIGETLLNTNPKIHTVLAKDSSHEGVYRTQAMRLLAGEDTTIGVHKENNISLAVDVSGVYFSSRLSTERKRIAQLVKAGEKVLVMFSGCGPYTCVIAKNTQAAAVIGIEINPRGHELALENIKRNKLKNALTYCGDVWEVIPTVIEKHGLFDRILMPLPKSAETFLDIALEALAPKGTIHFYAFMAEEELPKAYSWIAEACKAAGLKESILSTTTCGQQSPRVYRFCIDFRVS